MFPSFNTQRVFKELQCNSTSLQGIIAVWRDRLKNDIDLQDYCLQHYGTEPKIVVGCKAAAAADCPVIVIRPGSKMEYLTDIHRNKWNIRRIFREIHSVDFR